MEQSLLQEDRKDTKIQNDMFSEIYNYYREKEYTFLQIKMTNGNIFNIAINDLIYWTYSAFFCYFRKNKLNQYEIDDSSNTFRYSYPCPNYSLEETKNLLISKNSSLGLEFIDMLKIIMNYLDMNKQTQLYDSISKTKTTQIGNFITFDKVFSSIDTEKTNYTIMFNSKNIIYDIMINPNEIISIMPIKYEFELLEIKDKDVLKLIKDFELYMKGED